MVWASVPVKLVFILSNSERLEGNFKKNLNIFGSYVKKKNHVKIDSFLLNLHARLFILKLYIQKKNLC